MAALLKKRALAEYSQTQEVVPSPPKKLRLVKKLFHKTSSLAFFSLLDTCKSHNTALQALLRISDSLDIEGPETAEAIKKLSTHFKIQGESAVRAKIFSLFADIGFCQGADIISIIDETILLMQNENSHKVIAQGLFTMLKLGKLCCLNAGLHKRLISIAKNYLKDPNHAVKCKCLELIGALLPAMNLQEAESTIRLVSTYFSSEDARVRSQSFITIINLHDRGFALNACMYPEACKALKDDYEIVRQAALQLVWVLSKVYPENIISIPESDQQLRLIDDAFVKVCDAINDLSVNVRACAAHLLSSMSAVSPKFLHQTLDKKLMSNMRKKRSAHERAWENVTSGEWASGKKWADDAPRELIDAESVNLMSSGACGAFVHGLEDEYLEVRSASVESLCQLSLNNPDFVAVSLDFLVDMFNDEIEDVRLKAIDSLRRMSKHIVLREDQLETILGALEDCSFEVREGLYRMLSSCHLATTNCLQMCVEKLLEILKKYPHDKRSTWRCMQKIGELHPELTLPLVPQLLAIHPFFDTAEPDVDQPSYVGVLILVLNAAQNCPSMLQLFEPHTIRHYRYLRDTMPQLVPSLRLIGQETKSLNDQIVAATNESRKFVETIMGNIDTAGQSNKVRTTLLRTAQKHLDQLAEMDEAVSGMAHFTALFIKAQLKLLEVLNNRLWTNLASLATAQLETIKTNIQQLKQICLKLQHLFIGLEPREACDVKQLHLKALAVHLVFVVRGSNASALAPCHSFLAHVEQTEKALSDSTIQPDDFTAAVFKELSLLDEPKPGSVARILNLLLQDMKYAKPTCATEKVQMSKAVILEPTEQGDTALKFTAGLVMAVPFEAELFNLADPSRLRLRMKYPDQRTQIIVPKPADIRPLDVDAQNTCNYRLLTTVLVSHQVWTEACFVGINVALALTDVDLGRRKLQTDASLGLMDLCKPVKICVAPKPIKRSL